MQPQPLTVTGLPVSNSCVNLLTKNLAAASLSTGSPHTVTASGPAGIASAAVGATAAAAVSAAGGSTAAAAAVAAATMATTAAASGANGAAAADRAVQSRLPPLALGGSAGAVAAGGQGISATAVEARLAQAEGRAAAVSGIRGMPEKPLALLYKLVDYMKVRTRGWWGL